jgi:hypothetical protein
VTSVSNSLVVDRVLGVSQIEDDAAVGALSNRQLLSLIQISQVTYSSATVGGKDALKVNGSVEA